MFNFLKRNKKEKNTVKQSVNDKYAQYVSDEKYNKMVNDYSVEDLALLVDCEEEPYVLSMDELQYMLTICTDVKKRGVIYYAIATCYHKGTRGIIKSHKEGMQYDKKAMDAQNPYATLRYGVNLTLDVGKAVNAGAMDKDDAALEYALGVGYIVKSYRQGCPNAKDALEVLMEGRKEFYGAHSVEELVQKWPK